MPEIKLIIKIKCHIQISQIAKKHQHTLIIHNKTKILHLE